MCIRDRYTREDTIRSDKGSELGCKTVGIKDQWVHIKLVIRMNNFVKYLNLGLLKYGSDKMYHGLPMKKLNIRIV